MIHNSSVIDNQAKISKKVKIGPFCYVGPNVELADDVELISNVHIEGCTKIGKGTKIFPFASIGTQPQDLKFKNEKNSLSIGENNLIREYVTINPGTEGGGSKTIIGNNCLFMISSHIAHDCKIGDGVIIANNVPLGGHVTIEDNVVIGGNSAVQQFTRIGRLAMIGGMTGVLKDVTPFGLSIGNRNYLQGINLIGLRRKKYDNKKIMALEKAYKEIFSSENLHENLNRFLDFASFELRMNCSSLPALRSSLELRSGVAVSLEGSVDDIGTLVDEVWHDWLAHGTVPVDISWSSHSVSVDDLVVLMMHWSLSSHPLSVGIWGWWVPWEHTAHVPPVEIREVDHGSLLPPLVVEHDWLLVSETSSQSSGNEECEVGI